MEFFAFEWSHSGVWLSLATLTGLEIVLGIDNLVFIAIYRTRGRRARGCAGSRLWRSRAGRSTRLVLLAMIAWIVTRSPSRCFR
jgi:predicted tellurium resistance membrane protein TerC